MNIHIFPLALQLYTLDHLLPPALLFPGAAAAAREEGRHGWTAVVRGGEAVGSSGGLPEAGRRAGVAGGGQRRKWVSWYLGWGPHTQTLHAEQGGRDQYFQAETGKPNHMDG